jgi:hypothetical protein
MVDFMAEAFLEPVTMTTVEMCETRLFLQDLERHGQTY